MKRVLPVLVLLLLSSPPVWAEGKPDTEASSTLALTGKLKPKRDKSFVETRQGYFKKSAQQHLEAMVACARDPECSGLEAPLPIHVCSQFRSHKKQKYRWLERMNEWRWIQDPALRVEYVSRFLAVPGSSRHHWGTDVDISPLPITCKLGNRFFMSRAENEARCARELDQCLSFGRARLASLCQKEIGIIKADFRAKIAKAFARCKEPERCHLVETSLRKKQQFALAGAWATCAKRVRKMERHCRRDHSVCPTVPGPGVALYKWLEENAVKYHFCQPYKDDPEARNPGRYTKGYQEERWHWSYCCQAEDNRKQLVKAAHKPSVQEVFGDRRKWRKQSSEVLAAYHRFVNDELPQFVGNTHPSCAECAARCPKGPVQEAKR